MASVKAHVTEDIPAHRFITTSVDDGDPDEVGIQLSKQSWDPDFYSSVELSKGTVVPMVLDPADTIWELEAQGEINAGRPVGNGKGGKVVDRSQITGLHTFGIALEHATDGDIVQVWRTQRLNGPVANELLQNSGGGTAWNAEKTMDAVGAGVKAGNNVTTNYDDKNGQLTISAQDASFSGQWADITGKPNAYPPETHGDGAHSKNYATVGQTFSGNYNDLTNVSIPTGDLGFDPATQGELNNHANQAGVHHSKYTDANAVSAMSGATISPATVEISDVLNMPAKSTAPSSPTAGDIYMDDGTNHSSGSRGWRQYDGTNWQDI